jgi:hypothetical protein
MEAFYTMIVPILAKIILAAQRRVAARGRLGTGRGPGAMPEPREGLP